MAATHEISNVCCVVRDKSNPAIFGYATTTSENTAQNLAHVFTTDSQVSFIVSSQKYLYQDYYLKLYIVYNSISANSFHRKKLLKYFP